MAAHERPLTAVFFLHLSASALPMIEAWLEAGHRIAAIIVYGQKWPTFVGSPLQWIALRWIVMRRLQRRDIPVVRLSGRPDWLRLRLDLERRRPDVAISYSFMRLVPESLLSLFPAGGLNFHPALLPYYRGPKPLHWLAVNNDWGVHGGVTLHEMSDAFDEGSVVAQAPVSTPSDTNDVVSFVSNALACMTRHVIPAYCAGDVVAWPQPPGVYPYASMDMPRPIVKANWTRKHLSTACQVFVRRPGVSVEVSGKLVRLSEEAADLGPPTGEQPVLSRLTVEFDLADRRVRYRRHGLYSKLRSSLRLRGRLFPRPVEEVPIRLGPFDNGQPDSIGGPLKL